MAEKEYIEREALLKRPNDEIKEGVDDRENLRPITYWTILGLMEARSFANTIPAADVVEVVHGEWIVRNIEREPKLTKYGVERSFLKTFTCSLCKIEIANLYGMKYCPNCGAKMDGGKKATP